MKIAICDDELIFLHKLEEIIKNMSIKFDISIFDKSENLLCALNKGQVFDIYILDIEMPEINGMELATDIKKLNNKAIIIFLTNHDKYVYDAFKTEAFRYIIKSRLDEEVTEAIYSAIEKIKKYNNEKYIVCGNIHNTAGKIRCNSIIYMEKIKKYTEFHLDNKSIIKERISLKEAVDKINLDNFVYICRGIVVNIEHIVSFEKFEIKMDDGSTLFMSRDYLTTVKETMLNYWGREENVVF